jgi:hypothetical protein
MRTCEKCGLSIGDAATFCTVCGARADSPAAGAASAAPQARVAHDGGNGSDQAARPDDRASHVREDAPSRRLREAALPMHEARDCETTDPAKAVSLYRQAILALLEAAADPLEREEVRHDLLVIFDRLSLVLKREGLPKEALEEIDCAASLGLLDCRDHGIKGHLEALRKRRKSLQRVLEAEPASR